MEYDQRKLFVWSDHDLIHARPDLDKGNLFFFVQGLDCHLSLVCELGDQRSSVDCLLLWHGGFDSYTFLVDDDNPEHTHMSVDTV